MILHDCPIPGLLTSNGFSSSSAYFLGSILAGDESYRLYGQGKKVWLALTKHNSGYITEAQLESHFKAVEKLTDGLTARMYKKNELVFRNWFTPNKQGFAAVFESPEDIGSDDICSFAADTIKSMTLDDKKRLILGAFDGRCSIDVNKTTGEIRYIVLDCGNDESMEILSSVLSQLGLRYNCNYARDRLEGGEPRKPQLRIAAASTSAYAQSIGFISSVRMDILFKALGNRYSITDSGLLPGVKQLSYNLSKPQARIARPEISVSAVPPKVNGNSNKVMNQPIMAPVKPKITFDQSKVFVGAKVRHKVFGDGTITQFDDGKHISVQFSVGEKAFIYPDAFNMGFLSV